MYNLQRCPKVVLLIEDQALSTVATHHIQPVKSVGLCTCKYFCRGSVLPVNKASWVTHSTTLIELPRSRNVIQVDCVNYTRAETHTHVQIKDKSVLCLYRRLSVVVRRIEPLLCLVLLSYKAWKFGLAQVAKK